MELIERARRLDADDPLAPWRSRFAIPDDGIVYLDGNSLGRMPKAAVERVRRVMEVDWAGGLIRSWNHWLALPRQTGDALAPILGAMPGEVLVHESTTVNLFQLITAAARLNADRSVIAVDPDDFPTDRYVVDSIASARGMEVRFGFDKLDDVAVVVRSAVDYRTAALVDLAAETTRARAAGAIVVWDLSHAAGVVELELQRWGVELATGCTYKFLNGGPGAPAFSYVQARLIERIDTPIKGWFGTRDQFAMRSTFEPRLDIGRIQLGTPGILGLTAARAGIDLVAEVGVPAIAQKAAALTSYALECCEAFGLRSPTPTDPARRGAHVSIRHQQAEAITQRLAHKYDVIVDFRTPDLLRLGLSPLTTRFGDVQRAVLAISGLDER